MTNEIVLFESLDSTIRLNVTVSQDTVWLTQAQMAQLYGVQRQAITKHLKNIYDSKELDSVTTSSILEQVQQEGKRLVKRNTVFYNLDVIISVGYRVNTNLGIQFRRWANHILKDYLLRGYCTNKLLQAMQERTDERFFNFEQRLNKQQEQIDFFIRTNIPPIEGIFYEGQLLDARAFAEQLIRSATREIILVDNYIDARTFQLLEHRNKGVDATIYVEKIGNGLKNLQNAALMQTRRQIGLKETAQRVHDRFLIVDDVIFHIGASLNELGKRLFAFSRLHLARDIFNSILN